MAAVAKPKVRKCQQKCYPLEPVQEDCVSKLDEVPRKQSKQYCGEGKERFKSKGGFLSKLRDSYVKVMNDMASSADYTAVSATYGCSTGHLDFPGAAAMAAMRSSKQDEEIEQVASWLVLLKLRKNIETFTCVHLLVLLWLWKFHVLREAELALEATHRKVSS